MLQCRALVTFNSRYGMVRRGERITVEPDYFLEVNLKVRQLEEIAPPYEPPRRQVLPQAPYVKSPATDVQPLSPMVHEPAALPGAGPAKPSASSPRGRPSRKPTPSTSRANAKPL